MRRHLEFSVTEPAAATLRHTKAWNEMHFSCDFSAIPVRCAGQRHMQSGASASKFLRVEFANPIAEDVDEASRLRARFNDALAGGFGRILHPVISLVDHPEFLGMLSTRSCIRSAASASAFDKLLRTRFCAHQYILCCCVHDFPGPWKGSTDMIDGGGSLLAGISAIVPSFVVNPSVGSPKSSPVRPGSPISSQDANAALNYWRNLHVFQELFRSIAPEVEVYDRSTVPYGIAVLNHAADAIGLALKLLTAEDTMRRREAPGGVADLLGPLQGKCAFAIAGGSDLWNFNNFDVAGPPVNRARLMAQTAEACGRIVIDAASITGQEETLQNMYVMEEGAAIAGEACWYVVQPGK